MATKKTAKRKSTAARRPRAIPSQAEYERNERMAFYNQRMAVEKASLADRKEAKIECAELMTRPAHVQHLLEMVLDGNYGFGILQAAKEVVANKRMNREAALMTMLGIVECQCPNKMTIDAWKSLTKAQQEKLDVAIKRAMQHHAA